MRRLLGTLAAVGLLAGMAAAPVTAASNGVARHQVTTVDYTIMVLGTYQHDFIVTTSPCDGSLTITGSTPVSSGYYTIETVAGTLSAGVISFSSTYAGPYNTGYTWSGSFPVGGGALSGQFTGTVTAGTNTAPVYANHGDYVSAMGGGSDAAHACVGMPIVSHQ